MKQEPTDQYSFPSLGIIQPKKSNIFITNERSFDLESAYRFLKNGGKFFNLTSGYVSIFKTQELLDSIREKLNDMKEDDWLLISGSGVISALAVKAHSERFTKLKLLIWDSTERRYKPSIIK